jgi:hypothetical protein
MKAEEEKLYTFRGKTFPCNPKTIQKLNLALAYNQSKERYEEVKQRTTDESRSSERSGN